MLFKNQVQHYSKTYYTYNISLAVFVHLEVRVRGWGDSCKIKIKHLLCYYDIRR